MTDGAVTVLRCAPANASLSLKGAQHDIIAKFGDALSILHD